MMCANASRACAATVAVAVVGRLAIESKPVSAVAAPPILGPFAAGPPAGGEG